jgi:glycosyltransferase involved in cell wall biosynthesis
MLSRQLTLRARAEQVLAIAADEHFDAVHAYGCYDDRAFVASYVASLLNKPLILTFCGQDLERSIFGLEKAKRLLCQLFKPKAEVRLIHNHISEDYFDPDAVIEPWGDTPIIGCFALFRRIVGLDVLLSAYTRLLGQRELTLALGGPIVPADLEFFNRQIEALPDNARVWRMGKVPHHKMLAAYRACDLIVTPSYADACPHKVLEAMLAGIPIVGTTAGGIPELLRNDKEALLVEPGDDEALARAIAELLDNPGLSQRLASQAQARVLTRFTREREQSKWISAYQSIGLCA